MGQQTVTIARNVATTIIPTNAATAWLIDGTATVTVGVMADATYGYLEFLATYTRLETYTYGQLEEVL